MYGTVARVRIKPGAETRLQELQTEEDRSQVPGYLGTIIYRMDADPREVYMVVAFDSKKAYFANADSPEQDARYRRYRDLLEGDPEWHDGEIIHAFGLRDT